MATIPRPNADNRDWFHAFSAAMTSYLAERYEQKLRDDLERQAKQEEAVRALRMCKVVGYVWTNGEDIHPGKSKGLVRAFTNP